MKRTKIIIMVFIISMFSMTAIAQKPRPKEGDFNTVTFQPAEVSDIPIEITLDYKKEQGEFSKFLFGVFNAPFFDDGGYKHIRDSNFKIVTMMERDLDEQRERFLSENKLEAAIFYTINHYLAKEELEGSLQALLDKINALKEEYPGLEIKTFLFANEPDLPSDKFPNPFWQGSKEELFEDYGFFANFLKSKNPKHVVGGLGFASAVIPAGKEWIYRFIEYTDEHRIPLDFVAYHGYSYGVKNAFSEGMKFIKDVLHQFPMLSPLYTDTKIALTELDVQALPIPGDKEYPQMDTAWRAAHNIMVLIALADNGLWMSCEAGGPFKDTKNDANFLWIKGDGTIKPIYYGHKAFNSLADTIQIAQEGSNFETFGVIAGKSKKNDALTIIISNYDEYAFLSSFAPPAPAIPSQSKEVKAYDSYAITIDNLPWDEDDRLVLERYSVDDSHKLELIESREIKGDFRIRINRNISLPEIQLIKLYKKYY